MNKCLRCNRPLKDPTAKYGAICLKKVLLEQQEFGDLFSYDKSSLDSQPEVTR